MKILSAQQTRDADAYTIENEPITSLELMERAASRATQKLIDLQLGQHFTLFCGKGNNGGDGLVVARLLAQEGCTVEVVIVEHTAQGSRDFEKNRKCLQDLEISITYLENTKDLNPPEKPTVLVDALLGSGLNRPLEGLLADVTQALNKWSCPKVAVDIPTGLFADDNQENDLKRVLKAHFTLTFQHPKRSFLNAFTAPLAGEVLVIDIGLDPNFYKEAQGAYYFVEPWEVAQWYRLRSKFTYKGSFGHAYLVAGSEGKAGAALLSAEAALRGGCGLLTLNSVAAVESSLNQRLPEAMFSHRAEAIRWQDFKFHAVGIGPGFGLGPSAQELLKQVIQNASVPKVLDADALTLLSQNKTWMHFLDKHTVLTPHVGEFKKLLGVNKLQENYLEQLQEMAKSYGVYILLKDSISTLASPSGQLFFCDFGSPALATAGTGDVLTGIILGLLAQNVPVYKAVLMAVYLHGTAGKLAAEQLGAQESVLASDLVANLGGSFASLQLNQSA